MLARRASAILQLVTDGRYDLRLEAGDYLVADAWAGGELRSARTLSGGESFVASLALALALSDTLAGSAALGALFLDEGFGTLDRVTLDAVTAVLESLTTEGRMVGVITHVPELSARLPARLVVAKGPRARPSAGTPEPAPFPAADPPCSAGQLGQLEGSSGSLPADWTAASPLLACRPC